MACEIYSTLNLLFLGRPAEFTIFTHKANGAGKVEVVCTDEDGNPAEVKMKDNKDGTYSVSYMPVRPGTYTITIKFASSDIPKSPYKVRTVFKICTVQNRGSFSIITDTRFQKSVSFFLLKMFILDTI